MAENTIGTARVDITADASSMQAAIETAKKSLSSMSSEAQAQYQRLSAAEKRRVDSLIRQADTVGMTRAQQIAYNASLRTSGPLLDELSKRLKGTENAAQKAGIQFNEYGLSAKQVDAALRQVPAQMTDIIVSLQGGQAPLTVLLQQGGQLRDIFGGIKPAVEAVGGAFLRLINPITVTVGAAIALAAAWYKGNTELDELRKHLAMTGGALGLSASQVSALASEMDKLAGVTRGKAVAGLTEVAKSGKIAGDQLALVGEVAVRSNQLLGTEISKTVEEFERLGEKPSEAAAELNKQYNFLTAAVYEQIRALEEQGRTQDAARLAQETYANVTNRRLDEVRDNLGLLESAWKGVAGIAKSAWDAMLGIGRESTLEEKIRDLDNRIKAAQSIGPFGSGPEFFGGDGAANVAALVAQRKFYQDQLQIEKNIARARGLSADIQREGIKAAAEQNKLLDDGATKAEKRQKALEENQRRIDRIRRANPDSELITPEAIAESIRVINEKFKDKQGKAFSNDAATKLLMTLREQEASLRAQIEGTDKLTAAQSALVKFEQQIADIKAKQTLTADEKSILAAQDKLRAQYQLNAHLETEALHRKALIGLEQRSAQIAEQMASARRSANDQYQRALDAFGLGDKAMQQVQAQRSIFREFERRQEEWTKLAAKSGLLDSDVYKQQSEEIQAELQRRLAMQQNYFDTVDEMQASWALGASHGLADYADESANAFKSMSSLASNAFKGMEDQWVSFVMTGKASGKDLVNSLIADFMRLSARQAFLGPLAGALGSAVSGWFAPTAPAGVTPGVDWTFASGGYTGPGGKYEPAGIVHRGEYVLNQDATRRIGVSTLDRLNRGYAAGGLVGGPSVPAMAGGAPHPMKLEIINQSGVPVKASDGGMRMDVDGYVQTVILKDLHNDGPIAQTLRGGQLRGRR